MQSSEGCFEDPGRELTRMQEVPAGDHLRSLMNSRHRAGCGRHRLSKAGQGGRQFECQSEVTCVSQAGETAFELEPRDRGSSTVAIFLYEAYDE